MDDFKGTLSGKTFTVDEKFQYAQGKGTNASRWLVYHDRNQKAYQVGDPRSHRLLCNAPTDNNAKADPLIVAIC